MSVPDDFFASCPLFADLRPADVKTLLAWGEQHSMSEGEVLFREGDHGDEFAIVEQGRAAVEKMDSMGRVRLITTLGPGAVLGEVAAIDGGPRSATVRAAGPLVVRSFKIANLVSRSEDGGLAATLWRNLARSATTHLERATTDILRESRQREVAGQFAVSTVGTICVYILTMRLVVSWFGRSEAAISALNCCLISVLAVITLWTVRSCGIPLAEVGMTLRGWKRSCLDAAWVTVVLLLLLLGSATLLGGIRVPSATWTNAIRIATYVMIVPLQEFATRGCIQGSLNVFLTGGFRTLKAVLICNLVFCAMHSHLGDIFPLVVFLPGMAWGWMFDRSPTLIGPSLSHAVVGSVGCFLFAIDK